MNIAILNHYASIPEMGSAETRHFELAKRFVKDGHSVDIYVGDFSHLSGKRWSETFGWRFSKEGVNFIVIKTRKYSGNSISRFLSSFDYYRNGKRLIVQRDYDVIIASSPHPFSWSLGWHYVKKKKRGRFFIEIRDVWPDDLVELGSISYSHPVSKLFDFMCKKYYPKADGIISLVPDLSKHFERLRVHPERFIFVPNGVDLSRFENYEYCSEVEEILSKVPKDKVKVLYAGSIVPHNGVKEFLGMLSDVKEDIREKFVFIFVGPSQPDYLEELKKAFRDLKNVFFFDPVPKKCVPSLFQKVDFLLFTLSHTTMNHPAVSSYKVLDYMASGKPVLCIDIEGILFKETTGAIFFNEKNLEKVLEDILTKDHSHLGMKNREYVERERDWDHLYEKLKEFIFS
ncbi:glycosyltransferase family 4 protein [Thermotoga sp. SG1]|uniref:glycosyltransferase family 4 protein n=1 Tax=Thermotoga sp. SG1 TaxID=126739 RepID=UPI000C78150D|nr:glycosyltransferase family 4 protein [Thermotoga sp. SG1]PLV56873.1 glycosyltransferase WbuB [Thermotoga sp. SG1]